MLSKLAPADTILLSDDGSEAESSELEDGSDDEDVPRPGVKQIGISKYYVPSWTTEDAFRELYQNWYVIVQVLACSAHSVDAL